MKGTTVIFDCPIPPWLAGGLAFAVMVAVLVFVVRDVTGLTRRRRYVILLLVFLASLMLTGLLLSPKLNRTWVDPLKARCMVLVDGSRSMLLKDAYTDEQARWLNEKQPPETPTTVREASRRDVVRLLLSGAEEGWLAEVEEDFELSAWRFGSEMEALALGPEAAPFEVNPQGHTTPLGEALAEALGGSGGRRPRVIILISDGSWNTGRDPTETARMLGQLGIPVFTIGVGDPNPPRDAAVVSLRGPKSVLLGDEILLAAQVSASGMGTRRLPVQLVDTGEVIEEKLVVTLPSGRPVNVSFTFVPQAPGVRSLTVRVPAQEREKDDSNNEAFTTVEVVERKIRTLLIDGEPRWEFRFIRNVLERDPAVKPVVFLHRPGIGPITGPGYLNSLPTEKRDLAEYDLVVLGDVARAGLPDAFLKELAEMVKRRSGALVVVAGRRGHYRELIGTPLAEVLPVKLEGAFGASRGGVPFTPELTQDGFGHLITRFSGDPKENEHVWSQLPPMTWAADVAGLSRGAVALLVHPYRLAGPAKLPILAVHRVGTGKVMWCGVEETWRWRKSVGDKYHYRFWAQAIRWMVKRPFAEGDPRARLSVDRRECAVGERVEVEAYCLGPDGFPLERAQVWLKLSEPGGESRRLVMEPAPGGWGVYRTTFAPTRPGKYECAPVVSVYGPRPLSSSATIEVSQPDLEKNFLAQDRLALSAVAEASGGKYLQINEAGIVAPALAAKAERRLLTAEYSPCRHWLYYLVLALVLGTAWLIRKRSGLA